jgi:meso-butanediol dehydrogenase/(S,S)-butanediol dehydrogenase/diacetyl reductase
MNLKESVGIVTGGARGIGRAISLGLARAGATVVVADINENAAKKTADEIRNTGAKALSLAVDVTDWTQVKDMADRTCSEFGAIDILVNNAGIVIAGSVEEMEPVEWDNIMAVNTKGAFLCCKSAVGIMKKQGGGSIVNIASVAGKNGFPNMGAYCASKHALIGLTRSLAKELANDNIRVNAVCPGIVRTAMWEYLIEVRKDPDESSDAFFDRYINLMIPLGKPQKPDDIAELVVFLAGSENITAQAVNVDGGMVPY